MSAHVVVLGGGFGGLYTALEAQRRLGQKARITLIDRNDYFLFTPLLHQIVSNRLGPRHLTHPIPRLLPREVEFIQTTVREIDLESRSVASDAGSLSYDFLVIALGSVPNFYGIDSVAENAFPFKWLPDAQRLRIHLMKQYGAAAADPSRAPDLLRMVITGAGCTGIELVAEIHDWMRGPLRREIPGVPDDLPQLILAEALDHLLCPMDPELMRQAARQLLSRRIDVRLGTFVKEIYPDRVRLRRGDEDEEVAAGTAVWAAGIKPNPMIAGLPVAFGPGGRIHVTESLQVPSHPEVLAIGDLAACPDSARGILPATAQVAVQQAPAAARNLDALLTGKEPAAFRYRNKGEAVGMGYSDALVQAFGSRFTGLPGWLLEHTVHLARLPDWGDRVSVAWEWAKQTLGAAGRV